MSEKLKELLEKINEEGIKQADEKARAVEAKAHKEKEKILIDAKTEAETIIQDAKKEAKKLKETTEIALKQASRDLMLSLKEEIKKIFSKVIGMETGSAMSAEEIAVILAVLIEKFVEKNGNVSDVKVLLKKEDLDKLRATFIAKLKDKLKEGIEFKASPNIKTGFSISFDKAKSFFDFTDEGLVEALCTYLSPEITNLLKV